MIYDASVSRSQVLCIYVAQVWVCGRWSKSPTGKTADGKSEGAALGEKPTASLGSRRAAPPGGCGRAGQLPVRKSAWKKPLFGRLICYLCQSSAHV